MSDPNNLILIDQEKIAQLLYTSLTLKKLATRIKELESQLIDIQSTKIEVKLTTNSTGIITLPYIDLGKFPNGVYWVNIFITGDDPITSTLYGGSFSGLFKVEDKQLVNGNRSWQTSDDSALAGNIIDFSASGNWGTVEITPINNNPILWKITILIN